MANHNDQNLYLKVTRNNCLMNKWTKTTGKNNPVNYLPKLWLKFILPNACVYSMYITIAQLFLVTSTVPDLTLL